MNQRYIYILSNKKRSTFYLGVTHDIRQRVAEQRNWESAAFIPRDKQLILLYVEQQDGFAACTTRLNQLRNWHRDWKLNLIRKHNPKLIDLAEEWYIIEDGKLTISDYQTTQKFHQQRREQSGTDPETSSG